MSSNELDSLMRRADMARKEEREEGMDWSEEGRVGHTPGPWRIEPTISPPEKYICADKPEGQAELARVYDWAEYGGNLPAEANALLMAAAPELLGLAREAAEVGETIAALLCSPGEATKAELVSIITDLGTKAAALINNATKEEA